MQTIKFVRWEEDGAWLGYLAEYPDYLTQGDTLEDLKEHLKDLYHDLTSGELPGIRKTGGPADGLEGRPTLRRPT